MAIKLEIKERLEERLKSLKEASTPTELAYSIWTRQFEAAVGISRDSYRNAFIGWILAYKEKTTPKEWTKYKTPEELADAVWYSNYDRSEEDKFWYGSLRSELVKWIKAYCGRP